MTCHALSLLFLSLVFPIFEQNCSPSIESPSWQPKFNSNSLIMEDRHLPKPFALFDIFQICDCTDIGNFEKRDQFKPKGQKHIMYDALFYCYTACSFKTHYTWIKDFGTSTMLLPTANLCKELLNISNWKVSRGSPHSVRNSMDPKYPQQINSSTQHCFSCYQIMDSSIVDDNYMQDHSKNKADQDLQQPEPRKTLASHRDKNWLGAKW